MRITMLALGSRGDVQPFIALGLGFRAAGHSVCIAAAADYEPLVRAYGLDFAVLVGSIQTLMDPQVVAAVHHAARNPLGLAYHFFRAINPLVEQVIRDATTAAADADILIMSTLGHYCGIPLAEHLGIPAFVVHMHPYTPTGAFPQMFFPTLSPYVPGRAAYNQFTHWAVEHAFWHVLRRPLDRAQHVVLGLPPHTPRAVWQRRANTQPATLLAYSPQVVASPPDWQPPLVVTGYWHLAPPPNWRPSPALTAFLADGPPPVYIGFGSMLLGADAGRVTRLVIAALAALGLRGILHRGWNELGQGQLPPSILLIDDVPHSWLLPQTRLVVHHGGAGVTAATLCAGVPMVVVPFLGDQHFWARRMETLGVAPAALPRAKLSQERLIAAIHTVLETPAMQAHSATLGRQLQAEQGVSAAVAWIEQQLGHKTESSGSGKDWPTSKASMKEQVDAHS